MFTAELVWGVYAPVLYVMFNEAYRSGRVKKITFCVRDRISLRFRVNENISGTGPVRLWVFFQTDNPF